MLQAFRAFFSFITRLFTTADALAESAEIGAKTVRAYAQHYESEAVHDLELLKVAQSKRLASIKKAA